MTNFHKNIFLNLITNLSIIKLYYLNLSLERFALLESSLLEHHLEDWRSRAKDEPVTRDPLTFADQGPISKAWIGQLNGQVFGQASSRNLSSVWRSLTADHINRQLADDDQHICKVCKLYH